MHERPAFRTGSLLGCFICVGDCPPLIALSWRLDDFDFLSFSARGRPSWLLLLCPTVPVCYVQLVYLTEYLTPTHGLNAILYPQSSQNTVRCIAVYASSGLSVHYTRDFNKFMHLYCLDLHSFTHTIQINLQSYPHPTETNVIFT